jgi:pimeloyl-ACP methyl ester carboxylesterase
MLVRAVDLHANLEVGRASMADYATAVVLAADRLPKPVSLCGWSMGGLVALLASQHMQPHSLVLMEPSAPAEIQGVHPEVDVLPGTFDPEEAYGPFPAEHRARVESSLARAERKRGISAPSVPCPSLVVYGREFPDERGRRVARLYGSTELSFSDADHWDLVSDVRVLRAIRRYLISR